MNVQEPLSPSLTKKVDLFRYHGWAFLILGSLISVQPVRALFDPQATVLVDGGLTSDLGTKLGVAAFTLSFAVVGGLIALPPRKTFERWVAAFIRWSQVFASGARR